MVEVIQGTELLTLDLSHLFTSSVESVCKFLQYRLCHLPSALQRQILRHACDIHDKSKVNENNDRKKNLKLNVKAVCDVLFVATTSKGYMPRDENLLIN